MGKHSHKAFGTPDVYGGEELFQDYFKVVDELCLAFLLGFFLYRV